MFSFLTPYKMYIAIAALLVATYGGWTAHSWYADSKELAVQKAVATLTKEFRASETNGAVALETKLKALKAKEKVVERETIKIIDRPVYSNECLDVIGVQLLNDQRSKQDPDSGKPAS